MTERLTLATAPERPELAELLRKAAKIVMTPEQVREQRRSWVRGQIGLTHPDWPEEKVRRLVDEADERVYGPPPTSPPGFRDGIEAAAKVVEGRVYKERYREWTFQGGNRSDDSEIVKFANRAAAAIRAIPTPDTLPTGWNSHMGEAPRDGTSVLLTSRRGGLMIGFWNGHGGWDDGDSRDHNTWPTHWMPLPPPPPGE